MLEPTTPTDTTVNREAVNREVVKIILQEFLKSNGLNVLAIKGRWGVGKTHLVKEVLEKSQNQQEYYYASLFGIGAIEQLKSQLLNSKNPSIINQQESIISESFILGLEKTIKREYDNYNYWIKFKDIYYSYIFKEITKGISALLKFFTNIVTHYRDRLDRVPKTQDIHLGGLTVPLAGVVISLAGDGLLYWLFNQIKRGSIICIDDLERKSEGFKLDELLGLIEYLVQKLECKVILIYNEEFLNENKDSKESLETYREKVIDIEIEMNPTVEESLDIVFENRNDFYIPTIKEVILATETNNIRVIQKILFYINKINESNESNQSISNWEAGVREQIIKHITIFALAKLDKKFHDKFKLRIEDILSNIHYSLSNYDKNKDKGDSQQTIEETLFNLGYIPLKINEQLIKLVDQFLFDENEFIIEGNKLNEREKNNSIINMFNHLWKPFYNSFGDSEQELAQTITNFLEEYNLYLSPREFESLEKLALAIESLNISQYEYSFLKYYLENEPHYFYNSEFPLANKLHKYPDLEEELQKLKKEYKQKLNITTALGRMMNEKYHVHLSCPLEIEFLNECTIDDYYQWLKKGHNDLTTMIYYCRDNFNTKDSLNINIRKAIIKLAGESKLNKMRAKLIYSIDE